MKQELYNDFLISFFDEIDSTNSQLSRDAIKHNMSEFNVYLAEKQNKGRGRMSREWRSFESNLHFSILLRPNTSIINAHQINFISVMALGNILEKISSSNNKISYKWPNDLLVNSQKIAGILQESFQNNNKIMVILGIGVNINKNPSETIFPSTNLDKCNININKYQLLKLFLDEFKGLYSGWQNFGFNKYQKLWLKKAFKLGEKITININNKPTIKSVTGIFKGITPNAELELLDQDKVSIYQYGDVS